MLKFGLARFEAGKALSTFLSSLALAQIGYRRRWCHHQDPLLGGFGLLGGVGLLGGFGGGRGWFVLRGGPGSWRVFGLRLKWAGPRYTPGVRGG